MSDPKPRSADEIQGDIDAAYVEMDAVQDNTMLDNADWLLHMSVIRKRISRLEEELSEVCDEPREE